MIFELGERRKKKKKEQTKMVSLKKGKKCRKIEKCPKFESGVGIYDGIDPYNIE